MYLLAYQQIAGWKSRVLSPLSLRERTMNRFEAGRSIHERCIDCSFNRASHHNVMV